jgi:predicted DNA-binding WGR domain protein
MTAVYLTRVDDTRNMARYYAMSVQPALFGEWSLVREWGRIGCGGQVKAVPYPSESEALLALGAIWTQKRKRGYETGSTL